MQPTEAAQICVRRQRGSVRTRFGRVRSKQRQGKLHPIDCPPFRDSSRHDAARGKGRRSREIFNQFLSELSAFLLNSFILSITSSYCFLLVSSSCLAVMPTTPEDNNDEADIPCATDHHFINPSNQTDVALTRELRPYICTRTTPLTCRLCPGSWHLTAQLLGVESDCLAIG